MRQGSCIRDNFEKILSAARDEQTVSGFTHNYYKYPARFAPTFVRTVIQQFSSPGDTILDPFLGGGTTVVEGLALNRRVIGIDLNPIAVFVSKVKSTPLRDHQLALASAFLSRCSSQAHDVRSHASSAKTDPRFLNTPWWLRGAINFVLSHIEQVPDMKVQAFLQCALLKTSQWALDCRATIPDSSALILAFRTNVHSMCAQMREYRRGLQPQTKSRLKPITAQSRIMQRSAAGLHLDKRIPREWLPIKLVLTSPPYPGVHILYHRWQVRGRRETAAPYAVIASPDGHTPSYFTMGGRHEGGLERYFRNLRDCFSSVAKLMDRDAYLIQLVSIANQKSLLPKLLNSLEEAGFERDRFYLASTNRTDGIWRNVPNRKWYAPAGFGSGRELLLVHRPAK
jgi:DNA modification methylase